MKCGFGPYSQTSQEGPRKVGESAGAGPFRHSESAPACAHTQLMSEMRCMHVLEHKFMHRFHPPPSERELCCSKSNGLQILFSWYKSDIYVQEVVILNHRKPFSPCGRSVPPAFRSFRVHVD